MENVFNDLATELENKNLGSLINGKNIYSNNQMIMITDTFKDKGYLTLIENYDGEISSAYFNEYIFEDNTLFFYLNGDPKVGYYLEDFGGY